MQDFWQSSGYQTLQRNDHGWLRVTPEYLQLILARPELAPIAESGAHELALHAQLLENPQQAVTAANWRELKTRIPARTTRTS